MLVNKRSIHIEWGDCDPLGIVYFPRYFEFFDACTNALFERAGLPKQETLKKYAIAGIPLVESRARFLLPSSSESCTDAAEFPGTHRYRFARSSRHADLFSAKPRIFPSTSRKC